MWLCGEWSDNCVWLCEVKAMEARVLLKRERTKETSRREGGLHVPLKLSGFD